VSLADALTGVIELGRAIRAAVDEEDLVRAADLVAERQRSLAALEACLERTPVGERDVHADAWRRALAEDRELRAYLEERCRVLGAALANQRPRPATGDPYLSPPPSCYDRQA
jgi:hypothetical protein